VVHPAFHLMLISLLLVAAFVVANTFVDLLYAVLDPRVAMGSRAA